MNDFDKKIKDSKECIEKSNQNDSHHIYEMAKNKVEKPALIKRFNYRLVIKYAIIVMFLLVMFTGGFFISKSLNKNGNEQIIYRNSERSNNNQSVNYEEVATNNKALNFGSFETKDDLINYLNDNKINISTSSLNDVQIMSDEITISPKADAAISNSSSSYQTNTQVENVDEADIVKVVGNHIFYLATNVHTYKDYARYLYMLTENDGELFKEKTIEYNRTEELLETIDNYSLVRIVTMIPNDLYVTNKYVVVRVTKTEYKSIKQIGLDSKTYYNNTYDYGTTCYFEIYDVNDLSLVKTIELAGSNVSTRLIGNSLYVVNNYNDYLRNNNRFYFYPYFFLDDVIYYPYLNHIYYCEDSPQMKTYVSLYKIILDDEFTVQDLHILTPTVDNIYSSEKNIYLIRTYGNDVINEDDYQLTYPKTRVVVVNIEGDLTLAGNFDVKGKINDKYWIDEKDEYIRVVTTGREYRNYYFDKKYVYRNESTIFNFLTIFKKTDNGFEESSSIEEGIGKPGESIRSARFNGDVVTIVTYRNIDPIYYVDISNPLNPVITSSLEVTGYSVYQHPYKDNYVIGFGYENDNASNGYKITLFDISDKEDIKQVGNSAVIYNYVPTYIENDYKELIIDIPQFFYNPKALFVDNNLGIYGFRLQMQDYYYEKKTDSSGIYYSRNLSKTHSITKYLIITIDENSDNPISILELDVRDALYRNYDGTYSAYSEDYYQRLVFIGDNYYLLSNNKVNTFTRNGNDFIEGKELLLK